MLERLSASSNRCPAPTPCVPAIPNGEPVLPSAEIAPTDRVAATRTSLARQADPAKRMSRLPSRNRPLGLPAWRATAAHRFLRSGDPLQALVVPAIPDGQPSPLPWNRSKRQLRKQTSHPHRQPARHQLHAYPNRLPMQSLAAQGGPGRGQRNVSSPRRDGQTSALKTATRTQPNSRPGTKPNAQPARPLQPKQPLAARGHLARMAPQRLLAEPRPIPSAVKTDTPSKPRASPAQLPCSAPQVHATQATCRHPRLQLLLLLRFPRAGTQLAEVA